MPEERSVESKYATARHALVEGRIDQACRGFSELLDACPDALDDVAATFGCRRDRARAVGCLREKDESAEGLTPTGCALAARLARDLGCGADAMQWAERAVAGDPACAAWWFELAAACHDGGDRRRAATACRRCLELDPDHMAARSGLSLCRSPRWGRLGRWLSRMRWTRPLLRRLAWSGGRLHLLEAAGDSEAAHQMRWMGALEEGAALALIALVPSEMEPEDFSQFMEEKPPAFWRWFQTLDIEAEVCTVLDVGCGTGFAAQHFVKRGMEVTGLTCNEYEKRECLRRGLNVIEEDFHFLSLPDESTDLVFSSHSLEHSIAPLFALWEWKRVLRPGGYLLIIVPLAIDQDPRVLLPEYYDEATDRFELTRTGDREPTAKELAAEHAAYGISQHPFVLNHRQYIRLFQLVDFDLVATAMENPGSGEIIAPRARAHALSGNLREPRNGMFLLRKPGQRAGPSP